jgi:hypothetical protein
MLLSFLGVIREQVKQRVFRIRQASEIRKLYGDDLGWPQARLLSLLRRFYDFFGPGAEERRDPELEEMDVKESGPREPAGEPQYQELLRLLDEEIAHVQEEFEYAEKANEEKAAIERDAALAPVGEAWNTMVRLESALDRSIDRKVRILLALRREYAGGNLPSAPSDGGTGTSTADMARASENDVPSETPQPVGMPKKTKLTERSLNVHENTGREIPERGWNAEANRATFAFSEVTHV